MVTYFSSLESAQKNHFQNSHLAAVHCPISSNKKNPVHFVQILGIITKNQLWNIPTWLTVPLQQITILEKYKITRDRKTNNKNDNVASKSKFLQFIFKRPFFAPHFSNGSDYLHSVTACSNHQKFFQIETIQVHIAELNDSHKLQAFHSILTLSIRRCTISRRHRVFAC